MGYRAIEVDGRTYEYTVGKTHVKVRGFNAVRKETVGAYVSVPVACGCCGELLRDIYSDHVDPVKVEVRPEHVVSFIQRVNSEKTHFVPI